MIGKGAVNINPGAMYQRAGELQKEADNFNDQGMTGVAREVASAAHHLRMAAELLRAAEEQRNAAVVE